VIKLRVHPQVEASAELDRAQNADRILVEASYRVANRTHRASRDVFHPAAPIEHFLVLQVVKERVDGEVAAHRVFIRASEEVVAADQELVAVAFFFIGRTAKGRRFDHLAASEQNVDQTKAPTYDARVTKQSAHVFRPGAGGYVEVFRVLVEQQIANAPSDQV